MWCPLTSSIHWTADVDGNGKIEAPDRMILARYLAGWTGYDKYFK